MLSMLIKLFKQRFCKCKVSMPDYLSWMHCCQFTLKLYKKSISMLASMLRWADSWSEIKFTVMPTDNQGKPRKIPDRPVYSRVVSHGTQIGGLWVFADQTHTHTNTNAFMFFAHHADFDTCLSSSSNRNWCRLHIHLTNHRITGKTWRLSILSRMLGWK